MAECIYIKPEELMKLQESSKSLRVIDIRSEEEHKEDNIGGSECIQVENIPSADFNGADIIVFHCKSGIRTQNAEPVLSKINVEKVYILEGGLNSWKAYRNNHDV